MKISEIRQALIGKQIALDGRTLMYVHECRLGRKQVILRARQETEVLRLSRKCAEALAMHGVYWWHTNTPISFVHILLAVEPLKLTLNEEEINNDNR